MSIERMPEKGKIKLCGGQGCCPEVDFTQPDKVVITDDHGGKVQLTKDEWGILKVMFTGDPATSGK